MIATPDSTRSDRNTAKCSEGRNGRREGQIKKNEEVRKAQKGPGRVWKKNTKRLLGGRERHRCLGQAGGGTQRGPGGQETRHSSLHQNKWSCQSCWGPVVDFLQCTKTVIFSKNHVIVPRKKCFVMWNAGSGGLGKRRGAAGGNLKHFLVRGVDGCVGGVRPYE